jgi:rod shape-determining protein MreC
MLGFRDKVSGLDLVPAEVSVIGWFEGTLIIDQGSVHGIRESMCVLSPEGIIGVVTKAEPYQSLVYTLHHADCRIGSMIERTRAHGVVRGSGSDFTQICQMEYIDSDADVRVNDRVVTSGSSVFPAGYLIGYISAPPEGEGSLLKTALVQPAAQVYQLDEVFVLREATTRPEQLAGPGAARGRGAPVEQAAGPDDEPLIVQPSLQERYAP